MKKLMFLFIAIATFLLAFEADAQVIRLNSNQTWASYTGAAGDTAKTTTAKNFDIFVAKGYMYYYDVGVSADSSGDGTNFSVQLSGSNDESNWYTVGSAQTWYVSETDTIMRFTNMTSVSTSTSIAATTDYHDLDYPARNLYHDYDTSAGGSSIVNDTVSLPAFVLTDTVTVGAQTITETLTESSVGWRYLRVGFTGAGAGARMELGGITIAIRPKVFSY